jgi:carbon starvation protein
MHALPVMAVALGGLVLGYRFYAGFIARRVLELDPERKTPACAQNDGANYKPEHSGVLFGHHFAAIAGAGPLIGPVLAAQYGWLPGLLWLVPGAVLGGAVQDFVILAASLRHGGKSLAEIAREELGPRAGLATAAAILFIVIAALAGLGFVVVNALANSAWGTFTIAMTIPIALLMGLFLDRRGSQGVPAATALGVAAMLLSLAAGRWVADDPSVARFFILSPHGVVVAMGVYGFFASVLPVGWLLVPRGYLSSFMKLGVLGLLVLAALIVNPALKFPALSGYLRGGPVIPGPVFPFLFITIMCGAISGFHALVSSGTTPKMLSREPHARPIGYGGMLLESLVGIVSLIAASSLEPGDYYAINLSPAAHAAFAAGGGAAPVHLAALTAASGEGSLLGRSGGSALLAVGFSQILSGLPGLKPLMPYLYHFAILFEALFILTTIDTGTRITRFVLQELGGKAWKPFGDLSSLPASAAASAAVVLAWAWLIWNGSIGTIWPLFGIANQSLAVIALAVGSAFLRSSGRGRYAWVTALPMAFVALTTASAAFKMVFGGFWPAVSGASAAMIGVNDALIALALALAGFIAWRAIRRLVC